MNQRKALFAAILILGLGRPAWSYSYFYQTLFQYQPNDGNWVEAGTGAFTGYGYSPQSGSLVFRASIGGASPNDYELKTYLDIRNSDSGTIALIFRASSLAEPYDVQSYGSFISAEIQNIQVSGSSCTATLSIKSYSSGTATAISSTQFACTVNVGPAYTTYTVMRGVIFGQNLWIYVNDQPISFTTVPLWAGAPGIGGESTAVRVYQAYIGVHDTTVPNAVDPSTVHLSLSPNDAAVEWQGAYEAPAGTGILHYNVYRSGSLYETIPGAEFDDPTVSPSTTETYSISAVDFHGNESAQTPVSFTTPPAGWIDPRHVGVRSTGAYWGGGGEQIDLLSGNLNFAIPLLSMQQGSGAAMPSICSTTPRTGDRRTRQTGRLAMTRVSGLAGGARSAPSSRSGAAHGLSTTTCLPTVPAPSIG